MIAQNRILWLPGDAEDRHVSWDDTSPSSSRNPSGIRIDSDTAIQSTVVLACARVLAESLASLPLHLYEYLPGGGKAPAKQHPLYRRLHVAPNSWQTAFEWREQQVLWLALWGNSYNLISPGSAGFATELLPMHPSRMTPERIENGRIRYKYRDEKGREEIYTQDQIMHIRWLSDDGVNGMVPVELAKDAIGLARACEIHGARFFGNGARPGFVLTTDNDMKPEAAVMLRDNWERMHRGAGNSSRTAVLFGGLKPHELGGASNQESQFLETRRFQIEEICRLYRVPPHLVGDLTRSSFSNIEQQSIDFVQHTLLPWCRRFENAFARDLIVEDERYFAEFDTRGLLRGDAAARASYYTSMYNLGVASINEIRSWENLNPVDGGDLRFVQLNMQTLDQANAAATTTEEPEAVEPPKEEKPTAAVGDLVALVEQIGSGAITPEAAKAAFASVFPQMPESVAASIIEGAIKKPEPEPTVTEPMPEEKPAEVTEQPAPAPAGRSLWQGSLRDSEGRSLTISIDFDRTFAADPELMGDFATKAKADGNTVVMITRRADTPEDRDFIEQTLGSYADAFDAVILAGPDTQKETAAKQAGISVDIWIDDSPQTIKEIRGFCPTGAGGGVDNSCGKDGGGGKSEPTSGYRKSSAEKALAAEKAGDRREIVSYVAYRQFRDESSGKPMQMIEEVEKASSTESMYRAMQSGNDWQGAGGWESAADEWAAAQALGANAGTSRATKQAISSMKELSEQDVAAFEARRKFAVESLRAEHGDEVTLYRGIKGSQAKKIKESGEEEVELGVRSIASFATVRGSAEGFAGKNGVVVEVRVPVEDAWMVRSAMPRRISSYSDDAGEVVLMNRANTRKARVVRR
jgi:HK97 family phage portal protein